MNSALVSARAVRGIETDWAWASGAPAGLILDAWNIRLLPHYALGVFFILAHLSSGLRQVLLAHGVRLDTANRGWIAGLAMSGLVALAIRLPSAVRASSHPRFHLDRHRAQDVPSAFGCALISRRHRNGPRAVTGKPA